MTLTIIAGGLAAEYDGHLELSPQRMELLLGVAGGISVLSRSLQSPPRLPGVGHRYIVASPAGGAWAGREDHLAVWVGDSWAFVDPSAGLQAWDDEGSEAVSYTGSAWEPVITAIAGSVFPSSPQNGQIFTRSDLDYEAFIRDAGRSKWLSLRSMPLAFTNQATVSAGSFLRLFQGPFTSSVFGFRLPWDATLVEISSGKNDGTTGCNLEVTASGTTKHTHTMTAAYTAQETGLNVDFTAADLVGLRVAAGSTFTTGGSVTLVFRRKAT